MMMMQPQIPPMAGEYVIGCAHASHSPYGREEPDPRNGWEWFESSTPISVSDPINPGNITARWIACCASCLRAAGGDPRRVTLREHWQITGTPVDHHNQLAHFASHGERDALRNYLHALSPEDLAALLVRRRRS